MCVVRTARTICCMEINNFHYPVCFRAKLNQTRPRIISLAVRVFYATQTLSTLCVCVSVLLGAVRWRLVSSGGVAGDVGRGASFGVVYYHL